MKVKFYMKTLNYLPIILCLITTSALAAPEPKATVKTLVQSDESWDGSELPNYPKKEPEVTVVRLTLPPKAVVPWHKHPEIVAAYVLSGELTVIGEGGKKWKAKKGEAFLELVDQWHMGRNDGSETVELVVFYAGAHDLPLSIAKPSD